jgi:ferredoxin
MRVIIDKDKCTGHGRCYSLGPSVFDTDEYGNGVVITENLPEELLGQAQVALQNCPERAISVTE